MRTGVRPDAGPGPEKGKVPQFVLRILLETSYCFYCQVTYESRVP